MVSTLSVDIQHRLELFTLRVQFTIGAEVLVLFGPSGAGKTQTLQAIAGLMKPDAGRISLDETIFFQRYPGQPQINLPPQRRRIGYVFQQYALFPHMTALDNVALPIGRGREARQRAYELLDQMKIARLAQRMPHEMSGGQQQRVAIARALAAQPNVLLFDESFSALDQAVRNQLHADLRSLQAERGLIVVYVTHNLDDAFAVGQRIAILQEGKIEQIGALAEVCRFPSTLGVAQMLGLSNIIKGRVVAVELDRLWLELEGYRIEAVCTSPPPAPGSWVTALIRPEEIRLVCPDRPPARFAGHNLLGARVIEQRPGRRFNHLWVAVGAMTIEIAHPYTAYIGMDIYTGQDVHIGFRPESVVIIPDHSPQSVPIHSQVSRHL
ncbi:MAG: ABC transporter ATP-binding protein [Chloroflexus sp.]|uniref:ABC transporter ATP-binding protein n=1 Tax=Chloroflexus sp. TaxID=1904827 RepID=UPI00404959FF